MAGDNEEEENQQSIKKLDIIKLLLVIGKVSKTLLPHSEMAFKGKLKALEESLEVQTLDSYFEQVTKKLDNDFLRVMSLVTISDTVSNSYQVRESINPEEEKEILGKAGSSVLLKNDFDEFIIRVIYKNEPLKTRSSIWEQKLLE